MTDEEAVKEKKRGPKSTSPNTRLLRPEQQDLSAKFLIATTPSSEQGRLWTVQSAGAFLQDLWDGTADFQERTICNYLKRWGLIESRGKVDSIPQLSNRHAAWYKTEFKRLRRQARHWNALVFWIRALPVQLSIDQFYSYGSYYREKPVWQRPDGVGTPTPIVLNAVNNQGKNYFLGCQDRKNEQLIVQFLWDLCIDTKKRRKIFIFESPAFSEMKQVQKFLEFRTDVVDWSVLPSQSDVWKDELNEELGFTNTYDGWTAGALTRYVYEELSIRYALQELKNDPELRFSLSKYLKDPLFPQHWKDVLMDCIWEYSQLEDSTDESVESEKSEG